MRHDAGVGRIGVAGGILLTSLVMGCVGMPVSADEDAGYVPREYFGAPLEPKDTVLHGAVRRLLCHHLLVAHEPAASWRSFSTRARRAPIAAMTRRQASRAPIHRPQATFCDDN